MKKLITATDVRNLITEGEKILYVEPGTIVTPSARDVAKELKITISDEPAPEQQKSEQCKATHVITEAIPNSKPDSKAEAAAACSDKEMTLEDIPQHLIAEIVKKVLDSMPGLMAPKEPDELVKVVDPSGVLLVKGNTAKCETFDTGNPKDKVGLKETLTREQSPHLAAGFMEMEESAFDWTLTYNEVDYVIEGTLDIIVDGKTYRGHAGDVFYIPEGTSITFATPDKCKFFYATTPWPAFL